MSETRLVAMTESEMLALDSASAEINCRTCSDDLKAVAARWRDDGVTEEDARPLCDSPALLSPMVDEPGTFPYRVAQATTKLRSALSESPGQE